MRTLFLSLLCLFGALTVLQAQDPGIAYQAVARDADGDPLADAELDVRVTLYGSDDAVLWQESHASVLTNQFGNLALTFGDGAVTPGFGALGAVDWSAAGLHFGIEVDAGAGYASFGDVDVQAVPIAMYALNGQEEEIAALQGALDALGGDVDVFVDDLYAAIAANASADAAESADGDAADSALQAAIDANAAADAAESAAGDSADAALQGNIDANAAADAAESAAGAAEDALLLGMIQANDGDIALLQTGVNDNTMDLADLFSVITVGPTGITVEDLTITGDLDITGVFGAATGLFNYLSANNADFEDMIAEAAQVEQLTFFEGHALGDASSMDIDGTLNVDGQTTMGGDLTVAGAVSSQGSFLATEDYADAGDAAVQADVDANEADSDAADAALQAAIDANAAADAAESAAGDAADAALQADVDANEANSDAADAALQSALDANAAADAAESAAGDAADSALQADVDANEADSDAADAALQSDLDANSAADAAESAAGDAADATLQANIDANTAADAAESAAGDTADAALQANIDANAAADAAESAAGAAADAAMADDIDDNEFRIAAAAADMGFGTSTVGSVNNVPQHPGYDGAGNIGASDNLVEADLSLDAAISANAAADAAESAAGDAADATLQSNIDANAAADAAESAAGDTADAALQSNIDANAAADAAESAAGDTADAALQSNIDANAAADAAESAAGDAADAALQSDIDANETASDNADATLQSNIDANAAADAAESAAGDTADAALQSNIDANAAADAAESAAGDTADAALQSDIDANETASDNADATLQSNIDANAAADAAESAAGDTADATLQSNIDANAAADAAESAAGDTADAALQSDIDANETASDNADAALQGQIDGNDGDILALQQGLSSEISARQFGDAANANAIGANTANLNAEIQNREDADSDLSDYDAYLLDLISNTANTPLDVANILEGLDYFDDNGSGTVNLEAGWSLVDFGSAQIQASTSSFDAVDAQTIDADDANIQNMEVTNNLVSPAGTIGDLDATSLEVYQTSDLDGAVTMGSTLNVSGETTLGADVSVTGDVSATGNVSAADATAAGHLASFGQLTTAADTLQDNIDDNAAADAAQAIADAAARAAIQLDVDNNESDSDAADVTLQSNIDANATADAAQATADAAARAAIQLDVDNNESDSDAADVTLQNNIDANATADAAQATADAAARAAIQLDVDNNESDSDAADVTLQNNIDANATADAAQATADAAARAAIQLDVDNNESDSDAADVTLQNNIDANATADAAQATADAAARAAIQLDVDNNESDSDAADVTLQSNIDANATADAAQATADAAARAAIQLDVDNNESDSDAADVTLQSNIDANATADAAQATADAAARAAIQLDVDNNESDSDAADVTLQNNIDANATADAAQATADAAARAAIQLDVDNNESDSDAADVTLQNNIDANATADAAQATADAAARAAIQLDVDNNESDSDAADVTLQNNIDANATADAAQATADAAARAAIQLDVDNNESDSDAADVTLQNNIDANATADAAQATADAAARAAIQLDVDNNESDSDAADVTLQNNIDAEVTRATTREDSIINQMYWNQAVAGTVTLDAGVTDLNLAGVGIQATSLNASQSVTAPVGMITQITSSEASIEEMQAEDINTEDLTAIHIRGIGTGISTVDFDGTLNVDGVSTLQALNAQATTTTTLNATGAADMDAGLNVDGASTLDGTTIDGDLDLNGDADVSGTLDVTGTSTLGALNAGATSTAALTATGAADMQAGLNVDGATTLDGTTIDGNLDLNGNADVSGTLDVTGTSTLGTVNAGAVSVTSFATSSTALVTNLNADQLDSQDGSYYTDFTNQVVDAGEVTNTMVADDLTISGGDIDNTPIDGSVIGGTTPAAGSFTTLATSSTTLVTNLNADQLDSQDGSYYTDFTNQVVDASEVTNTMVADDLTISGGDIDNTPIDGSVIGGTTPAAGSFTTLATSSTTLVTNLNADQLDSQDGSYYTDFTNQVVDASEVTNTMVADDLTISGGDIDNTPIDGSVIGGTTPAAGSFTTLATSSTTLVTNLNADQLDSQEGSYYTDFTNQVVDASEVTNTMVADDLTISGGTVDGSVIGGTTPAAGSFTTLATSSTTLVTNLNADQLDSQEGSYYTDFTNQAVDAGEVTNTMVADDLTISGGDIDNTPIDGSVIGGTTPAAGSFTTLATSSTTLVTNLNADQLDSQDGSYYTDFTNQVVDASEVTNTMVADDLTISGGDIDNTPIDGSVIGGTTPAAGSFTTLATSSTTLVTNLNADQLDSQEGSYYTDFTNQAVDAGEVTNTMVADDLTISGGTVDGSVIGGTTPAAGSFTTLATSSTTLVTNLNADQLDSQEGSYYTDFTNQAVDAGEVTNTMVADDLTISGGTVDGSVIGGTTPAAGSFTTLATSSTTLVTNLNADQLDSQEGSYYTDFTNQVVDAGEVTNTMVADDLTISGGDIDNTPIDGSVIGGTTPAAGSFTTLATSSTTLVTNLNADQLDSQEGSYYTDFTNQVVDASEVTNTMVADDLTISGGDIDNTPIDGSVIGGTTAAAADVTTLKVEDTAIINESRDEAGDVFTIYDDGVGSVMTVSTTTGVHISDLTLNNSFSLTGTMSASSYTTTAGDPVTDNQLARKAYVDAQIAANMTTAHVYSTAATSSTIDSQDGSGQYIYYLNGANVFYEKQDAGDVNNGDKGYTFTVYGSGLTGTTASLWLRGYEKDLSAVSTQWNVTSDSQATFGLTYDEVVAISTAQGSTQTAGGMVLELVIDDKHSGVQFHFHLDNSSTAPNANSFN